MNQPTGRAALHRSAVEEAAEMRRNSSTNSKKPFVILAFLVIAFIGIYTAAFLSLGFR